MAGTGGGGKMKLASPAFNDGGRIPEHHTCMGEDVSPELVIDDVPEGTQSLALTLIDPTSTYGTWIHWLVYDIPVVRHIPEGSAPGRQGVNSFKKLEYGGPCPAAGTHTYVFTLYALDAFPGLAEGVSLEELQRAIDGHIIAKAELKGLYEKPPVPYRYKELRI